MKIRNYQISSLILKFLSILGGIYSFNILLNSFKFIYLHFICYNSLLNYQNKNKENQENNKNNNNSWVIITGSSAGIGEEYCNELAKKGMNLILISRSFTLLNEISKKLKEKYLIEVIIIIADCEKVEESIELIYNQVKDLYITMLINNVGVEYGEPSPLLEKTKHDIDGMINVNIRFTTFLTQKILPILIKNASNGTRCAIIHTASVAQDVSPPLIAVYSATKAYTTTFSRSLSAELRMHYPNVPIDVICLRPGFVETKMSGLKANTLKGRLLQVLYLFIFLFKK